MKQKVDRDLLVNTMILANSMHDNLEIMLDEGWLVRDLKMFTKNLITKFGKFTEEIYKNTNDERLKELSTEIDLDREFMAKFHKLSTERKKELLTMINQNN